MWRKTKAFLTASVAVATFTGVSSQTQDVDERDALFEKLWADHLPEYCLYTHRLPDRWSGYGKYLHPFSKGKYTRRFGETWMHLHHYCFGMEQMYQALNTDDNMLRYGHYVSAVKEFDYVLGYAPDDFTLLPEIRTKKGAALASLGKYSEAVDSYVKAIKANGDYVPAYIGLSSCFEALGDSNQALAVIDVGLQRIPGSEALATRRSELTAHARARIPEDE